MSYKYINKSWLISTDHNYSKNDIINKCKFYISANIIHDFTNLMNRQINFDLLIKQNNFILEIPIHMYN